MGNGSPKDASAWASVDSGSSLSNGTRINCYRVGGFTLSHLQAKAITGAPAGSAGRALYGFTAKCCMHIKRMVLTREASVLCHAGDMPAESSPTPNYYTIVWQACSAALATRAFGRASTRAWCLSSGQQLLQGSKASCRLSDVAAVRAVSEAGQSLLRYLQSAPPHGEPAQAALLYWWAVQ